MRRRFLTGLVAAGVLATQVVPGAASAEPAPDLTSAVVARLDGQRAAVKAVAATTPRVTITKQADGWAFGTAVLATAPNSPAMPEGWLFVAREDGDRWRVALEGEAAFGDLTAKAPVVSEVERPLLTAQDGDQPHVRAAGGDYRTGMALPFLNGQSWGMHGGPHGWSGSAAPWSSIDLSGGDQVVRSVRRGTAYTMCTGWIRVIHDRGYSTDYYHLWSSINVNGAAVGFGTYLGTTGTDVTCGGAATGRHVHFGLRQNSAYIGIADHNLGKWVLQNGGSAYQGSALHGSTRVNVGGSLYNYGDLGLTQAVIDTNGGGPANKRTGPGSGYALAGTVADGATVSVACSSNGTSHTGRWGTSSLWNKLTDGTWVSDAFTWTGVGGAVNGSC
ncbi:M23 family metallopeptidase [Actinophytocola xanthii]|uniref:Peptidase M23 n=1 Tax=Actinophytocola xanthii TaxID=1912961 RepID=A0A1Q8CY55_9PSEU|nr:peptidoglycan DD-metalloendopeptidase family protein [Actinophytocola xanthii]OLF19284.1 peptidase M23 [Actinophytocola xanthii]